MRNDLSLFFLRPNISTRAFIGQTWLSFPQNEATLLKHQGDHYKILVREAHALHEVQLVDR